MAMTSPAFTPVEASLFLTLCGRACDSRSSRPVLGDALAGQIVERTGYGCSRYRMPASSATDIALRAKRLDEVVRRFVGRHPNAIVLDLGAGLDGRIFRIDPPPTVDWYDVDFPAVIAARRVLVPDHPHVHGIGADLADPDWLDEVPADRPAVVVADGLVAFLTQDVVVALLNRLSAHLAGGELAFNAYTRFHVWAVKRYRGTRSIADAVVNPGFDDPRAPERWNPRLKLVGEEFLTRAPEVAQFPPVLRLVTRLAALSTGLSRRGTVILRYRFQPARGTQCAAAGRAAVHGPRRAAAATVSRMVDDRGDPDRTPRPQQPATVTRRAAAPTQAFRIRRAPTGAGTSCGSG
jgi:O-methyltransferase involved in polyketide biosynthesis